MLYTRIVVLQGRDMFTDNVTIAISNHHKIDMFTLVRIRGTESLPSTVTANRSGDFTKPLELLEYAQALTLAYEIYTVWKERGKVPMEYDNVTKFTTD